MSRKYLATLAAVAALVLLVGLLVRRALDGGATPAAAAPPSEAAALRQLSQETQVARMAGFLSQRAGDVAARVAYQPGLGAASVRLRDGAVVSTTPDAPVVVVRRAVGDSLAAPPDAVVDSGRRGWVLVVGRRADGGVLSLAGLTGGHVPTSCAGRATQEMVLGVPLHDALAGGGVFAVDGRLLGVVARCGARVAAIPVGAVARLLADDTTATPAPVGDAVGATLAPLDSATRAYFGADSGLLVTATRRGGAAFAAGVRAGDVLLAVDSTTGPDATWTVQRGRRVVPLRIVAPRVAPADSDDAAGGVGLALAADATVVGVRAGSAADAAGVRAGDRVVRVGAAAVRTSDEVRRRLAAAPRGPLFVVVARDSVERGMLLAR